MTKVNSVVDRAPARRLLAGHVLFRGMPATVFDTLLQSADMLRAAAGDLLFREGDPATRYLLVAQGRVEVLRYGLDGEERVFHLFERGELVADAAMFMRHGRYPMNARAQADVLVYRLARQALRSACETEPALAMRMLEGLSQRLYRRVNEVDWLTGSSASQRLAAYLLALTRRQGTPAVQLPITQRQLAAHLGVRAETLNRLFSEWVRQGRLRGRQRDWELCDVDHLRKLASAAARTF